MPDEEGILKWCSSLVRKTPDGDKLELAHFTVEEFLRAIDATKSDSPYAKYSISPEKQNLSLAKLCLTYLLFEDFQVNVEDFHEKRWGEKEEMNEFMGDYPFYRYSAENWAEHALAHRHDQELLGLVKTLFDPSMTGNFLYWSRYWIWCIFGYDNIKLISNTETLHFAAALSFDAICEWLIREKGRLSDLDKFSSIGTPLYCALAAENLSIKYTVIIKGAPPPPPRNVHYEGAESVIHNKNKQRTLECLLEAGARIDKIKAHPIFYTSPICVALEVGFGWDTLLERGAILDGNLSLPGILQRAK
jgi:hypothetical protein